MADFFASKGALASCTGRLKAGDSERNTSFAAYDNVKFVGRECVGCICACMLHACPGIFLYA